MVKNVFIEALWLEAPSHLLTSTWTIVSALPSSQCTDNYMPWFLPGTHPRIQNPEMLPREIQLLTVTPITPQVLVDMISREVDRDDIDDATNRAVNEASHSRTRAGKKNRKISYGYTHTLPWTLEDRVWVQNFIPWRVWVRVWGYPEGLDPFTALATKIGRISDMIKKYNQHRLFLQL
ncbi:hypothetical protein M9H77_28511 [Catharanthus roseus]|uniref:Uncharacterized protein n=1 Tax=Catharanthus roseus TaxID=4058 RepID=A0ACC0AI97_CATRO|nr:hypothetical protein M9H77_28511 [Catharanthus roseus]